MTSSPTGTAAAAPAPGLRGRKRERTRRAISDAAFRLFAEEGFEAVTLTRIAAAAEVAPATVFTHFASKEEIFFSRREQFREGVTAAVADKATGAEVLDGLRRFYADACDLVIAAESVDNARVFARVLLESPALGRSYLPIVQERRRLLAERLAERPGCRGERAELELFAGLVMAAGEAVFGAMHRALSEGEPADVVRAAVGAALARGFDRLARAYEGSDVLDAEPA
ncbi:hypothetical protein BLA24_27395 [Streptomyces cinnamoneus]|uniref:HTH tetR-type domain-containing protein n=1 Tax=Streptomyces cinnamoneus TaxID=53446 RepID=A0A2G1XCB2_STRCJ|nr:TetR/AcrR family transcriptional regulator [Streptomyces cinnamoneus]PHQ48799.1 hypothetical protein BLA24_27395 [Streptomyces cinnamoneus]PPT14551.1 hypothetical protein CYQ11_18250 [Streptomyces cinnamoneus]